MARAFARNETDMRQGGVPQAAIAAVLFTFISLVFMMGGSARADTTSLLLLRPLAAVALVFGLMSMRKGQAGHFRALWWLGGATVALILLHLIPLPPIMWAALPGREIITAISGATGASLGWQPLTIDPFAGWNSLFSTIVPAAALILVAAGREQVGARLVKLLCILVFISAFLGVLQVIGGASNGFYLYRITNSESATGLFANRNHNAVFLACGFPLLAAWASDLKGTIEKQRAYGFVAVAGAVALLPAILITESRAGVLVGAVGLVAAGLIYRRPEQGIKARGARQLKSLIAAGMATAAALVAIVLALTNRQTAFNRLMDENVDDDLRLAALPHIWRMGVDAFPFGWGAGSFVNAYKIVEPDRLLSETYLNHAHNDVLEVFAEFGILGAILMTAALLLTILAAKRLWALRGIMLRSRSVAAQRIRLGWVGLAMLLMLGVASVLDYPLRVPSLTVLAAIAAGFVAFALDAFQGQGYGDRDEAIFTKRSRASDVEEGSGA